MAIDLKAILAKKSAQAAKSSPQSVVVDLNNMVIDISEGFVIDGMSPLEEARANLIPVQLAEGEIDPRLKLLSHSSRLLLHKCPRKYELYRLNSKSEEDQSKKEESSVTFAFGHAVGIGIQSTLECKSYEQIVLDTFLGWDADLLAQTPRQVKSFWLAMHAVQKLQALKQDGYLEEYDLVYYNGQPAVELSFIIHLPGGFKYRGFVDAVLRHKITGEILVLEVKTSSGRAEAAQYKNSGQAVGYSVILDIMFPELSSYRVLYLVYETKTFAYQQLEFKKSLFQRALWLQELLIDCKAIEMYASFETYPMHGETCYDFFKECEYLNYCTMSNSVLVTPLSQQWIDTEAKANESFHFQVQFMELVEKQIEKGDV